MSASPIVCTWALTTEDLKGRSIHLFFDLTDYNSHLIVKLDLQRYSKRSFLMKKPKIIFKRHYDTYLIVLPISLQSDDPLKLRAHLDTIKLVLLIQSVFVTNRPSFFRVFTLAKRISKYSHAPQNEKFDITFRRGRSEPVTQNLC